jgi:cytochrome c-type biogenesis protein
VLRCGPAALAAALALAVTLPACGTAPARPRSAAVGTQAPSFRLANVRESDPDVSLSALSGRPVVINFWASWCGPCTREMPAFEAVHRKLGPKASFVGIDRQDARSDALKFLSRTGVTYPSGYDPEGKLDTAYRLRGTPTTVIVDAGGRITDHLTGPVTAATLEEALGPLVRK